MNRGRKPVVQCTETEWREMCRNMRACVPPPDGYVWRFSWCRTLDEHDAGEVKRQRARGGRLRTIIVRVARGLSQQETLNVLIHEVAHAFDRWDHHGWAGDHSDTYWIWHGRIWRRYWGLS